MTTRSTVYEVVQLGKESSAGSEAAATHKFTGLNLAIGIKSEGNIFGPSGNKYATAYAQGKEYTEASISSDTPCYDELVYLLSSLIHAPVITTPAGATNARLHTFTPNADSADTPLTFTVEAGSAVRSAQFLYGLVTGLSLNFDRSKVSLGGTMIGQLYTDNHALTAALPALPLIPMLGNDVVIKIADTQAGLAGATALANPFTGSWELTGKYGPKWVLNSASTSFGSHTELKPTLQSKLLLEADAEGMGLLTQLRSGATKWLRLTWTGPEVETGQNYSLSIDQACKVTAVDNFSDQDGVYAVGWTLTGVDDDTWGKPFDLTVVCAQTAIS